MTREPYPVTPARIVDPFSWTTGAWRSGMSRPAAACSSYGRNPSTGRIIPIPSGIHFTVFDYLSGRLNVTITDFI
jgi:hypothetical protein